MSKREEILENMKVDDLKQLIRDYKAEHENSGLTLGGKKKAIIKRILAFEKKIKKSKKAKKSKKSKMAEKSKRSSHFLRDCNLLENSSLGNRSLVEARR